VHIYPDGGSYKLRNAIAEKFGLEMGNVILGCGSNEVIEFIGHAFLKEGDNIITAEHAFLVYKLMAKVFGAETIEVPDPGYVHDLDADGRCRHAAHEGNLHRRIRTTPPARWSRRSRLMPFMAKVPAHVVVVFDEAY